MLRSSSSTAALERSSSSSSFSKVIMLSGSSPSLSSRKRGRKWFRPRLVALALLLTAVLGVEERHSQMQQQQQLREATPLAFPPPPYSFAHRGASGLLPEHTMQAYQLAVEQGADFIECDAVFTSDCALVCRHDADLSRSTDAASKFPSKASTREIDGVPFRDGVFAADLTLSEVRELRARQAKAASLGRTTEFDGLFPLVTLDEFAAYAARVPVDGGGRRWNETTSSSSLSSLSSSPSVSPRRRVVGVHVEAKHPQWHSQTLPHCAADPAAMVEAVAAVLQRHGFASRLDDVKNFQSDPSWLRAPTFLQCFEPGALAEAHRRRGKKEGGVAEGVPLVQLVDEGKLVVPGGAEWWSSSSKSEASGGPLLKEGGKRNLTFADLLSDAGLERVAGYAHAIGPSVAQVLDFPRGDGMGAAAGRADINDEDVAAFSSLAPRAARRGLAVHAYTLRDDSINLDRFKRVSKGWDREAEALFSGARVEGAFGDFPLTTARAARRAREEKLGGSKAGSSSSKVFSS